MGTTRPCFLKLNPKTQNLTVYGSAILVQRITADEQPSRIVACIPEEFCEKEQKGYFVENHLNVIQSAAGQPAVDLYFILGVLNSDIVEFFFRAMNGNTQVSATELNLLPMPAGKHENDIADLAKKIQKAAQGKRRERLLADLNLLVARAYGLSMNELEFIQKHLASRFPGTLEKVKYDYSSY
jgi:adenine-specific DNA-methyltransferase